MNKPLCIVAGYGPGNGKAFADKFHRKDYRIVLLARQLEPMQAYAGEKEDVFPFACDLSDPDAVGSVFAAILSEHGAPAVVIYNAGSGVFSSAMDTSLDDFETAWRVNALGLLAVAKQVVPSMKENGGGSLLVTGATASLRGGANFAAFASAKAAQRNLSQSLARSMGKDGIHVALIIIDGIIDTPRARQMFPDKDSREFLQPAAIAETYYQLAQQDKSCWTFELDIRPSCENW